MIGVLRRPVESAQYTSEQFQRLMADHGITCSMSRSGNVLEFKPIRDRGQNDPVDRFEVQNAAMESFFSSLKTERTARKVYRTRDDAKVDVFDYIERFYNPRCRHSTLAARFPLVSTQRNPLLLPPWLWAILPEPKRRCALRRRLGET